MTFVFTRRFGFGSILTGITRLETRTSFMTRRWVKWFSRICLANKRNPNKRHPFRVVLGWAYRGLTGGFLWLKNFSVAISVSPHVCFNFDFYVSKIMHL